MRMVTSKNPNHGKYLEQTKGYEDCGWQMDGIKHPKTQACIMLGHKMREVETSMYLNRGTDHV